MSMIPKPPIHVACAIIERASLLLAVQRSSRMSMPLKWEFPGGKLAGSETAEECLKREIREELDAEISLLHALQLYTHRYPDFTVTLHPFICSLVSDNITLNEHAAAKWLTPSELLTLDWAAADLPIIRDYLNKLQNQ